MEEQIKYQPVPIGIMPRHIWLVRRWGELGNAIMRYIDDGQQIPLEWVFEYNKLDEEIKNEMRNN